MVVQGPAGGPPLVVNEHLPASFWAKLGSRLSCSKASLMVRMICWIRCGQGLIVACEAVRCMYTPCILCSCCGGCSLLCFMWKPSVLLSRPKAKGVESTPGVLNRLYAAIIVHNVDYGCGCQGSGQGGQHVTESVAGPHASCTAEEKHVMEPQCGPIWCQEEQICQGGVLEWELSVSSVMIMSTHV